MEVIANLLLPGFLLTVLLIVTDGLWELFAQLVDWLGRALRQL